MTLLQTKTKMRGIQSFNESNESLAQSLVSGAERRKKEKWCQGGRAL